MMFLIGRLSERSVKLSIGDLVVRAKGSGAVVDVPVWYDADGSNDSRWKSLTIHAIASGGNAGVSIKSSRSYN